MGIKDVQQFKTLLKKTDKIDDSTWKVTTAKRITLLIPDGIEVYDTDLDKFFVGDGVTQGGVAGSSKLNVRKVAIAAAASGTLSATTSGSTNSVSWPEGGAYLRTGDYITLAAGTGTLPSGVTAGSYYIIKNGDTGDGASNTGTTFKLATTRANALAGTAVSILSSGSPGWTAVIAGVGAKSTDDVLLIDPVSAAVSVFLPDADSSTGFSIAVKRAKTATNAVTIKELDASGNVSASGDVTVDDAAGYVVLKAATDDYANLFADSSAGEYWTNGKQVTP